MRQAGFAFRPRKRFGQNFLNNEAVIEDLVKCIHPKADDKIVEVGPGLGAMTFAILPHVNHLDVIELDRDLAASLRDKTHPKLTVHEHDALQFDFNQLISPDKKIRIVGNLPYNISTPLLFHFLSFADGVSDMFFMLQKEVVDRLIAQPGTKAYGRLSVMVQYACQVQMLRKISPDCFYPVPKVQSAFIRVTPHVDLPEVAKDFHHFAQIVQHAFGQRRKTLRNSLHEMVTDEDFVKAGIDSMQRAEQLSVKDFVHLSNVSKKN